MVSSKKKKMRQRRERRKYSEDSDIELEKKDKVFRPPQSCFHGPVQKLMCVSVLVVLTLVAVVLHHLAFRAAVVPSGRERMKGQCQSVSSPAFISQPNFTIVVLGGPTFVEHEFRKQLTGIQRHLSPQIRLVFGLRRSRSRDYVAEVIESELPRSLLNQQQVIVCDAIEADVAWTHLWSQADLVTPDFIILDAVIGLNSGWFAWLTAIRQEYPDAILSLDELHPQAGRYHLTPDVRGRFIPSYLTGVGGVAPSQLAWKQFMDWFGQLPKSATTGLNGFAVAKSPPGWDLYPKGEHSGWAKPFAHFVASRGLVTLHATPHLAESKNFLVNKH